MKLFLSSEGVPRSDQLRELLAVSPGEVAKVALINNAQDPYPEDLAMERIGALNDTFSSLDFEPVNIDLREYTGKTAELITKLRTCNLIWCAGGNSFSLRYAMKTSGFDEIIRTLLAEGIAYGGWSAGAVVAGPSLRLIELMDDPGKAPEIVWEGLGLIPYFIWPHWDMEKYLPLQKEALERMKHLPYESMVMRDGEVLIIDNGQEKMLS